MTEVTATPADPPPAEGWALTMRARLSHYYRDGGSLCGRERYDGPCGPGSGRGRDDCPDCYRARRREAAAAR